MAEKTFDVVIPVYKPDKTFQKLLAALHRQTKAPGKIILIHTREGNEKVEIGGHYDDIEIHTIRKIQFDHGGSRNLGASFSKADHIVFMTQDALPQDDRLFEELLRPFSDETVAVTYARQLPKKDCLVTERYVRNFNYPDADRKKTASDLPKLGIKTYFCSDVCAAYRRDRFDAAGGFASPVLFNEDMLLAASLVKAGYAVYYAAGAMVVHSHRYTNAQQFHRNFDLGVSQADHPEVFTTVKSEKEGKKMVRSVFHHLAETKRLYLVPSFVMTCAAKYIGFFLGKHYKKLSRRIILRCTSDPSYWKK